jgi:hypothetical protein
LLGAGVVVRRMLVRIEGMAAIALEKTGISSREGRVLDDLLLARVAVGGATRAEIQRDLSPLLDGGSLGSDDKIAVEQGLTSLAVRKLLLSEGRGRWRLTEVGRTEALKRLGVTGNLPADWGHVRNVRLVAVALGLGPISAQRARALNRPDGLRAAVLQQAFDLPRKAIASPARLRSQLAVVALQRAFGNTMKSGLGAGDGLSPKAGRLLAGQLARQPRDFGTDSRLVSALAAEVVGATRPDIDGLRLAILRRWIAKELGPADAPAVLPVEASDTSAAAASRRVPAATQSKPAVSKPAAASRPDLVGFAAAVQAAARARAHGWPGSYKAYVSHVWEALSSAHPEWGISEVEFKGMLAEAHRTGHVRLANADLKDRAHLAEIQRSAIVYKNTVWHLVRVED